MKIFACRALTPRGMIENAVVDVLGGRIVSVGEGLPDGADITCDILTPGLYDKHEHGAMGFDCSAPEEDKCREWLRLLAAHGVTNVLYTVSTGDMDKLKGGIAFAAEVMRAQKNGDYEGARVEGVHMEGPFISHARSGAMAKDKIAEPSMENFYHMAGENVGIIKAITIAPEVEGAAETARQLSAMGIKVQAGHTDATCAQAQKAFREDGFSGVTHFYNAARPLNQREPGVLGAALTEDNVNCEAICDFVHVAPEMLKVLIKLKGAENVSVISDSVKTAGYPDGEYFGGNHAIIVSGGLNYTVTGGIAGGAKQADTGVRDLISIGISPEDAFKMGSTTPAKYLGHDDLGMIAPGARACLAAWDKEYKCVWAVTDGVLFRA